MALAALETKGTRENLETKGVRRTPAALDIEGIRAAKETEGMEEGLAYGDKGFPEQQVSMSRILPTLVHAAAGKQCVLHPVKTEKG